MYCFQVFFVALLCCFTCLGEEADGRSSSKKRSPHHFLCKLLAVAKGHSCLQHRAFASFRRKFQSNERLPHAVGASSTAAEEVAVDRMSRQRFVGLIILGSGILKLPPAQAAHRQTYQLNLVDNSFAEQKLLLTEVSHRGLESAETFNDGSKLDFDNKSLDKIVKDAIQLPIEAFGDNEISARNAVLGEGLLESGSSYLMLVSDEKGIEFEVAGMARIGMAPLTGSQSSVSESGFLTYVIIRQDLRGRGLGSTMVRMLEKSASGRFKRLYLWTSNGRRRFYERLGYTAVENWSNENLFDIKQLSRMHQLSEEAMTADGQLIMFKSIGA